MIRFLSIALGVLLIPACALEGEPESTTDVTSTTEQAIGAGVPGTGCTIYSNIAYDTIGNYKATGEVTCGNVRSERAQICVEWLVTGGWQTQWCNMSPTYNARTTWTTLLFHPANWSPRWYRARAWVTADGHTAALYSDGQYLGGIPE